MTTRSRSIINAAGSPDYSSDRARKGLLAEIAAFWRAFIKTAFNPYHPEQHYMRGPGPACAAKRALRNH